MKRYVIILGGMLTIAVAAAVVWFFVLRDPRDIRNAKHIFDDASPNPAATKYISAKVVAATSDRCVVHVVADVQNALGATIRESACVVFRYDGDQVKWFPAKAVQPCSREPFPDEIGAAARANGWE